jgi:hypothetical protein
MVRWYRRDELLAAAGGCVLLVVTLLVVIAVLSAWAHHSLSTTRLVAPNHAAVAPATTSSLPVPMHAQLRAWLSDAEPSIDALLVAGGGAVDAGAHGDIARTSAACQTTAGAVTNVQVHLPSPEPALNAAFLQAITEYQVGVRYCIAGTRQRNAIEIGQAAGFIEKGETDLQTALDAIIHELCDDPGNPPEVTV